VRILTPLRVVSYSELVALEARSVSEGTEGEAAASLANASGFHHLSRHRLRLGFEAEAADCRSAEVEMRRNGRTRSGGRLRDRGTRLEFFS
jgi:hypothetical protein